VGAPQARIRELFAETMELEPSQRHAHLARVCRDNPKVQQQVESLIRAAEEAGSFLASPLVRANFDLPAIASDLGPLVSTSFVEQPMDVRRHPFFTFAVGLGVVFLLFFLFAGWMIIRYGTNERWYGWSAEEEGGTFVISTVEATGPAGTLLRHGDRIIALNDDPRNATAAPDLFLGAVATNSTYRIAVRRGPEVHEYSVRVSLRSDIDNVRRALAYVALSFAFYCMGMIMALGQPGQWVTRLGFIGALLVSLRLVALALSSYRGLGSPWEVAINKVLWIADPWHFAVSFHFFYLFLSAALNSAIWRRLLVGLYISCAAFSIPLMIFIFPGLEGANYLLAFAISRPALVRLYAALYQSALWDAFEIFCFGAICAAVAWGYRHLSDPDQRRRVQWVIFGAIVGITPFVIYSSLTVGLHASKYQDVIQSNTWAALGTGMNLPLIAIPAAITYAIVRHRVLGISVVIRRGVRYLLARRFFQICLLLPAFYLAYPVVLHPERPLTQAFESRPVSVSFALIALSVLGLRYRETLRVWLDRRFFRAVYEQEQILRDLISRVKIADTVREIAVFVSVQLETALHPQSCHVLHRSSPSGRMTVGYSSGPSDTVRHVLSSPASIQFLERLAGPADLFVKSQPAGGASSVLAVPVIGNASPLSALVFLGAKKAEEPYTKNDRALLGSMADQMALAYEKVWLRQQVEDEQRIRREVLGRLDLQGGWLLRECPKCGSCFDELETHCHEDGVEVTLTLPVSRLIAGRYQLDRRVGAGGMGTVYRATDVPLDRVVALKILTGHLFGDHPALARFEREAKIVARLRHPGIVTIHDFGRLDRGGAFLVMEFVEGWTLRSILEQRGTLPTYEIAPIFDQLLVALSAAHEQGVLHRDLKPENVLVSQRNSGVVAVKLVDFGLAKITQATTEINLTESGAVMGTAGYMSPEQMLGGVIDERSDLFSVGVMIVEALIGIKPPAIISTAESISADVSNAPALNTVMARCIAFNPRDRFPTAEELRRNLIPVLNLQVASDQ
jgi:eukaryotic-like serine/threonine-protein kinase